MVEGCCRRADRQGPQNSSPAERRRLSLIGWGSQISAIISARQGQVTLISKGLVICSAGLASTMRRRRPCCSREHTQERHTYCGQPDGGDVASFHDAVVPPAAGPGPAQWGPNHHKSTLVSILGFDCNGSAQPHCKDFHLVALIPRGFRQQDHVEHIQDQDLDVHHLPQDVSRVVEVLGDGLPPNKLVIRNRTLRARSLCAENAPANSPGLNPQVWIASQLTFDSYSGQYAPVAAPIRNAASSALRLLVSEPTSAQRWPRPPSPGRRLCPRRPCSQGWRLAR